MRLRLVVATAGLLVPGLAAAHDTWILAAPSASGSRSAVRVEMTSGMSFPALESGIRPERVTRAMVRVAGQSRSLPAPLPTKASLRYTLSLPEPGVATFWVQLAPRALDLKPELIDEYLREIGAAETIGPRWRARPDPKAWREVYRKHAKTFLRTGTPAASDQSWAEPVGIELELVPESDPTALKAASTLSLVLLKDGRPLVGLAVAAERGSGTARRRTFETSDALRPRDVPARPARPVAFRRHRAAGEGPRLGERLHDADGRRRSRPLTRRTTTRANRDGDRAGNRTQRRRRQAAPNGFAARGERQPSKPVEKPGDDSSAPP